MGRSIILGVVGDSAAGKTTLTRGLVRVLGEDNVTHVCIDDYHRYDRTPARRAQHHAAPPRLQLHGHHGAAPRAHARGRAVPEAGLPAQGRHVRPARPRRARALLGRRGPARLLQPTSCAGCSTCASTSPRPRSSAASGRCSATARAAATRPTRCCPSSTAASPTRRRSSGRSATTPTSSSRSCRTTPATRSTSTPSSCCARPLRHPDFRSVLDGEADARTGSASASTAARCISTSPAGSSASAPR